MTGELPGAIPELTSAAALAYLMFNLYSPPCFAAIGAMNAEMKSKKWMFGAIGLQIAVGYTVGFAVYQLGSLITLGTVGRGFIPGFIAVAVFAGIITYLISKANRDVAKECKCK